jgi:hypothetical protein
VRPGGNVTGLSVQAPDLVGKRLPLLREIVLGTPINETLVNDLAGGGFIAQQRNAVLVGGTGTGKSHLAIAIARSCIRGGALGRFYNVVISSIASRPTRQLIFSFQPPPRFQSCGVALKLMIHDRLTVRRR